MAETGESTPKTSELYLGIVGLFVVILPGAIITSQCKKAPVWNRVGNGLKVQKAGQFSYPQS